MAFWILPCIVFPGLAITSCHKKGYSKKELSFFAALLSPVLDGFDQPYQLCCTVLCCQLTRQHPMFSEKNYGAVIRTQAGGAWSVNAKIVLC